jgi:hypothetical protein
MKTYGGSWIIALPFLISKPDGGEWSGSRFCRFTPDTHWTGGWVGRRVALDDVEKRQISFPCWESNCGRPVRSSSLYRLSYPGYLKILSILPRVRWTVTNNNGFWVRWLDLLALLLQLKLSITAHNHWLSKTRSIPYWTTSVLFSTDLVLIYESVTSSASVVRWLTLHSGTLISAYPLNWTPELTHGAEPFSRNRQLCGHSWTPQHFVEPEDYRANEIPPIVFAPNQINSSSTVSLTSV